MPADAPADSSANRLRELEEAVQARDDSLAVAAHDLRSPLHALALRLSGLERQASASGNGALAEGLAQARRSADPAGLNRPGFLGSSNSQENSQRET